MEGYESNKKLYFCGRELKRYIGTKTILYTILSLDLSEACLANVYSDNEIEVLFQEDSFIDNKQRSGGQSAPRFQRIRQAQIKQWYKKLDSILMKYSNNIIIDINNINQKPFTRQLHKYNEDKIERFINSGYSGLNGIYQSLNILNN